MERENLRSHAANTRRVSANRWFWSYEPLPARSQSVHSLSPGTYTGDVNELTLV
ncbi:hypothetical protein [Micromonospora globispora]|uniref:hypothetical protein n=1 Tax=Micromonospora globispora TaxID=1450148 RepID=UPI001402E559|nr:hypothetical protein [Micromonospora globispora]